MAAGVTLTLALSHQGRGDFHWLIYAVNSWTERRAGSRAQMQVPSSQGGMV